MISIRVKKTFFRLVCFLISSAVFCERIVIDSGSGGSLIELHKYGTGRNIVLFIGDMFGGGSDTVFSIENDINSGKVKIPPDHSLWVIPSLNPDGSNGINRNGVFVSRNFASGNFKETDYNVSKRIFCGKIPFSENESLALKKLMEGERSFNSFIVFINSKFYASPVISDYKWYNEKIADLFKGFTGKEVKVSFNNNSTAQGWLSGTYGIGSVIFDFKSVDMTSLLNGFLSVDIHNVVYKNPHETNIVKLFDRTFTAPKMQQIDPSEKIRVIGVLEKMSLNNELYILVNKKNYLDDNYEAADIVPVADIFKTAKPGSSLRKVLLSDLQDMFEDSVSAGVRLSIISSYRSFNVQKAVFNGWVSRLGQDEAVRVSARPGSSQHQLGTAIDFNMLEEKFDVTKEGIWLFQNSCRYGFVLSFPKNMEAYTGYRYEPWHYRYVGREIAGIIHEYFDNNLEYFLNWYWFTGNK